MFNQHGIPQVEPQQVKKVPASEVGEVYRMKVQETQDRGQHPWLSRRAGISSGNGFDGSDQLWQDVNVEIAVLLMWRQ
jgi:hypothetical protein